MPTYPTIKALMYLYGPNSIQRLVVLLILLWVGLPSFAQTEGEYHFERMWPRLEQPWYFRTPRATAVAPDGSVYIADSHFQRIQHFSADGRLIGYWGESEIEDGLAWHPQGIAVAPDGSVYVADSSNDRILRFSGGGKFISAWGNTGDGEGQFRFPIGIAVAPDSTIYISDMNDRIQRFSAVGEFISTWGREGYGESQFNEPRSIAVGADGTVYVADTVNNRIQRFDSEGNYISTWLGADIEDGGFYRPHALSTGPDGTVYVADTYNYRIQRFSAEGGFLNKWGSVGYGDGQFGRTTGIAVSATSRVYVTDEQQNRVQIFNSEGDLMSIWGSHGSSEGKLHEPYAIAAATDGTIYVAQRLSHRIHHFTIDGRFLNSWGSEGSGESQFQSYIDIDIGEDGAVCVLDRGNRRILRFTAGGEPLSIWGIDAMSEELWSYEPAGIAVAPDGSSYIAMSGGELFGGSGGQVLHISTEGAILSSWDTKISEENPFQTLENITLTKDGEIYLVDEFNYRILRFSAEGVFLSAWGSQGAGEGQFQYIEDIAVAPDDTVYVTDSYNHRIQRFDKSGRYLSTWGIYGSEEGQFFSPKGITAGESGTLHVIDSGNNRVQTFHLVEKLPNAKAIVVAGGGPYPGNYLWNGTQLNANFAIRTLKGQGYRKETLRYLSHDTELDLDNNGVADDVFGLPTAENLRQSIVEWAADAENLVLYLVDHGGDQSFLLAQDEVLELTQLKTWLDELNLAGRVTVVIDACLSGSAIPVLAAPNRIILTSAEADKNAKFLSNGSQSFSSRFWLEVFNGQDLETAFSTANTAMELYQLAQVDSDGDGIPNEEGVDLDGLQGVYIGAGTDYFQQAPAIGSIELPATLTGSEGEVQIAALDVTDPDALDRPNNGITRVWAVISPPNYVPPDPVSPVLSLPSVDLMPVVETPGRWENTWDGFDQPGSYQMAIYAQDTDFNTAPPKVQTVVVESAAVRRAIIVAAGQSDDRWGTIAAGAKQAYRALKQQAYQDQHIRYFSPEGTAGTFGLPTLANLQDALTRWAMEDTGDLVLHLIAPGSNQGIELENGELLTPTVLASWLDTLQQGITGTVTVVIDSDHSGAFIPTLANESHSRFVITATDNLTRAPWSKPKGISFSRYFWQYIANGGTVGHAFNTSREVLALQYGDQPRLDGDGNGIPNEKSEFTGPYKHLLGPGIATAADAPYIGLTMPDGETGSETAELWVGEITTTKDPATLQVWAEVQPPDGTPATRIDLEYHPDTQRWSNTTSLLSQAGAYSIYFYAEDSNGNLSMPNAVSLERLVSCAEVVMLEGENIAGTHDYCATSRIDVVDTTLQDGSVVTLQAPEIRLSTGTWVQRGATLQAGP
jgi:DNA-binding beta-propeller fold protein YncE